ncbi:polymerase (RNA) III (DNA directed) polypeptide A [Planoprotostelium fungivorum]|uniref:DNA-directed RNA polymerase subunit n=1 Tax=Planoprotostelium fungivorum TaxID=1890364 RepID=A0A2P6NYU7_9EUKA|nr:polymerase (RNA) III (DNA directed) polypeptide A [Planoprotostelium fungivorum]
MNASAGPVDNSKKKGQREMTAVAGPIRPIDASLKEFVEEHEAPKRLSHIQFGMFSAQDMTRMSEIRVVTNHTRDELKRPKIGGCLDLRLGTSRKAVECRTCGLKMQDCIGHFGYVSLGLPVFHIGYYKNIIAVLNMVCKKCSRILLTEDERKVWLKKMTNAVVHRKQQLIKQLLALTKKHTECCHCSYQNGIAKKIGVMRIVHERFKGAKQQQENADALALQFKEAIGFNTELKGLMPKLTQEEMNPLTVLKIFEKIINEDCLLLDMHPEHSRPENMIMTTILVPPTIIRPSVEMDANTNEDDLTSKLGEIIQISNTIRDVISKGQVLALLYEDWDFLQLHCALLINSEMPGLPAGLKPERTIRALCQRLKGKTGRFRGNLSGKRADFTSRTVISPDPNLRIDEVAVPELVAKILTYPEKVNKCNIEHLRKLIINGPDQHPGANYVDKNDGNRRSDNMNKNSLSLRFANRDRVAKELKIGDIVERHVLDGDIVLFNRQPSLHKISIMCHKARVMPGRTLRFNECVCTPYNADFDGDEMNLHVPQTEEARAEALVLMGVTHNLITPRSGEPLIAATQDFLTTAYLLTQRDTFYDRSRISQIIVGAYDALGQFDLPPPAIVKPIELWTGKQIFNMLICQSFDSPIKINLEVKSRSYTGRDEHMCRNDGWVCFQSSELISGVLDKTTLGSGNKNNIFHIIMRDFSPYEAVNCMSRLSKLCARWITNHGFSIGISDVTPSQLLKDKKGELVQQGYNKCDELIAQYNRGTLKTMPGCNSEVTLESMLNGELSDIREKAGNTCVSELHRLNSPLIMALSGSKGSNINISQMVACVGQQTVNGSRIPNGFLHRSLPHFEVHSRFPAAKGFVANSFFTGLTPTEFFFHTMGGREGLVDTAVKTADTGYMQRRLVKALEDLAVGYDETVRNAINGIVQFTYGDDGLDPAGMEAVGKPVDMIRLLAQSRSVFPDPDRREPSLMPADVKEVLEETLKREEWKDATLVFRDEIVNFWETFNKDLIAKYKSQGFDVDMSTSGAHGKEMETPLQAAADNLKRITKKQMDYFLTTASQKYFRAKVEPATAVGAVGAQSIGEPATQMTLKTFHFAGVASMNVTLGVPRIKEIMNASKKISTPIISAELVTCNSEAVARIVQGRIQKTTLGQIVEYISEVYDGKLTIEIKLDMEAIKLNQLEITTESVRNAILAQKKLMRLTPDEVSVSNDMIIIACKAMTNKKETIEPLFRAIHFKNILPNILVKGIPGVERAVINVEKGKYSLLVEGDALSAVMAIPGVVGKKTISNHVMTVQSSLGIEAARKKIIDEIGTTMKDHGIQIDSRHLTLLADVMTYKGEVLGINRFGIGKMRDSVFMLASFEKTTDHLFEAAMRGRVEPIEGISECIIMGVPIPIGTGMFKLLHQTSTYELQQKSLLLDSPNYTVDIVKTISK